MRRHGRTDANQTAIVTALRQLGAMVMIISSHGQDYPDVVVGFQGRAIALEIKNPKGRNRVSSGQAAWMACWPGPSAIVRSVEEAVAVVLGK
jgi:Holliday junction resolvase